MNLFELLMEDHRTETHRLIDLHSYAVSRTWPEKNVNPYYWKESDLTLQDLLERCCTFGETWLITLKKDTFGGKPGSAEELHRRLDLNHQAMLNLYKEVEAREGWEQTFVDMDNYITTVFSYADLFKRVLELTTESRLMLCMQIRALNR